MDIQQKLKLLDKDTSIAVIREQLEQWVEDQTLNDFEIFYFWCVYDGCVDSERECENWTLEMSVNSLAYAQAMILTDHLRKNTN